MTKGENKHYRRSHISENKFRQLLKCFALDLNAYETHQLTHISHRSCKVPTQNCVAISWRISWQVMRMQAFSNEMKVISEPVEFVVSAVVEQPANTGLWASPKRRESLRRNCKLFT